jgi:N-acetylneuraminate synthase
MARKAVRIGNRWVGDGHQVYVVAEIGINHNGSIDLVRQMIDAAVRAGCDAVKFQKRNPIACVPRDQWHIERETPWGRMTYIDYRHKIELGAWHYVEIDLYCKEQGIAWFASCWDEDSVEFMERFGPICYKIASASLTDHALLRKLRATGRPLVLSTGMSTMAQVEAAVEAMGTQDLVIAHSTSSYPCPVEDLNLRAIESLRQRFPECPIGYSGHEVGLAPSVAAVALGASYIERHLTLDRAMWGSDQAASLESVGFERLVRDARDVTRALGDGEKRVQASEIPHQRKLRRIQ